MNNFQTQGHFKAKSLSLMAARSTSSCTVHKHHATISATTVMLWSSGSSTARHSSAMFRRPGGGGIQRLWDTLHRIVVGSYVTVAWKISQRWTVTASKSLHLQKPQGRRGYPTEKLRSCCFYDTSCWQSIAKFLSLSLCVSVSVFHGLSVCLSVCVSFTLLNTAFLFLSVPAGSPSRGGDATVYVKDVNHPSLPTPLYSVLVYFCLYGPFYCTSYHKFSHTTLRFLTLFFRSYRCHYGLFN